MVSPLALTLQDIIDSGGLSGSEGCGAASRVSMKDILMDPVPHEDDESVVAGKGPIKVKKSIFDVGL